MNIETRLRVLEKIYALHADFCGPFALACGQGCARCCTANVTLTTLEALRIIRHWHAQGRSVPLAALTAAAQSPRFQPALTINRMAALCLQGAEVPEEAADPAVGPCPLLEADRCSIYPARPLACRAMVSRDTCAQGGAADMPEEILSANHLLMQFVEALDLSGASANLADALLFLLQPDQLAAYTSGAPITAAPPLAPHHAIPALMIPPELRARLLPLAQAVQACIRNLALG
ncbi:MAG: YkgJ family cysteine cluster protein [Desulfobacterales bacterium]|nr:YkgJ family cysteine cluster protein [Desulfobacterales bacterium]